MNRFESREELLNTLQKFGWRLDEIRQGDAVPLKNYIGGDTGAAAQVAVWAGIYGDVGFIRQPDGTYDTVMSAFAKSSGDFATVASLHLAARHLRLER